MIYSPKKVLIPGLVDLHVNLQAGGKEDWEGYSHGSKAAASGGVTTLINHGIMMWPSITSAKHLQE